MVERWEKEKMELIEMDGMEEETGEVIYVKDDVCGLVWSDLNYR